MYSLIERPHGTGPGLRHGDCQNAVFLKTFAGFWPRLLPAVCSKRRAACGDKMAKRRCVPEHGLVRRLTPHDWDGALKPDSDNRWAQI